MLLAGDIGGTKTDLAVFSAEKGPRSPLAQSRFHSADYPSLEAMAREFLGRVGLPVNRACFGVAGPVVDGRAQLTNLPWLLEETALREALDLASARLLNDLEAIANAVPHLLPSELHTLSTGVPVAGGAIAVIAPGTGLGEAFLTWEGADYRPNPSEGGHADFGPIGPAEVELLRYLQARFGHVSCERVCSGSGIPNLYDYLEHSGAAPPSPELAARLAAAEDRTPLILQAALDAQAPCQLCVATLQLFVSILGAEAGNLALKVLATGGVYLAGGITQRLSDRIPQSGFLECMQASGRFRSTLERVPVFVVTGTVALLGAAGEGLRGDPVAIRLNIDPGVPELHADAAQLERAFANLLENARRYSGGRPVSVHARRSADRVLISFVDQGPGIEPAERERIFEPFYRGRSADDRPWTGSGLGLAIAKGFVEANGGTIDVQSLPGQGTSFQISLPISEQPLVAANP